jgi:putative transposase
VIHLLRNTFRYAPRRYWDQIAKDILPVYTAPAAAAAKERFVEFTGKWVTQYPAIIRPWENAWSEFVPFLTTWRSAGSWWRAIGTTRIRAHHMPPAR